MDIRGFESNVRKPVFGWSFQIGSELNILMIVHLEKSHDELARRAGKIGDGSLCHLHRKWFLKSQGVCVEFTSGAKVARLEPDVRDANNGRAMRCGLPGLDKLGQRHQTGEGNQCQQRRECCPDAKLDKRLSRSRIFHRVQPSLTPHFVTLTKFPRQRKLFFGRDDRPPMRSTLSPKGV